jgi:large subunit ribosomal protein L10
MPKQEKVGKVSELTARFKSAQGAVFSDFRGLTVKDATELRHLLRSNDATFVVAKNTLTRLAANEAGVHGVEALLTGPTGIVFTEGDPIAATKVLVDAARRFPAIVIKGAWIEGHVLGEENAKALATIEPKEVSIAKVAGLLQSPVSRIAYLLQAPMQRIAFALAERGRQEAA